MSFDWNTHVRLLSATWNRTFCCSSMDSEIIVRRLTMYARDDYKHNLGVYLLPPAKLEFIFCRCSVFKYGFNGTREANIQPALTAMSQPYAVIDILAWQLAMPNSCHVVPGLTA